MNNPDLTKLGNSVTPDPSLLPTLDELAPQVPEGAAPVTGAAQAVVETITKELQKDSVSVSQEVAAATKLDPMPDAPVILAPPPASAPPKLSVGGGGASSEASLPGLGSSMFVTDSSAASNEGIPEEQKVHPGLGQGSPGSIPQTKNLSDAVQTEPSNIAPLLTEEVGVLSDADAVPEEVGPNRVAERMSEAQVNFMLAKVLDNVSQDAGLAGNPAASAASRKAFESFVGKILDSESLIKEKHPYFHDLTGLLALIFTAADSHPGRGVSSGSEGAVGVAMGFMAKSLKDGSELVALLMGAIMLANTVPYAAANETLQEQKADQNSLTLEFAKKYAERIIKLTSDPAYSGYLKQLVLIHEATATQERLDQYVSVLKIGLLLTAVALLYQAEMGGGTAEEVIGCLRPNQEIKQNDLKTPLLKQIKGYLDLLSTNEREAVLMAMMEYLDSKPDLKSITDPIKVMQGMKMTGAFVPGQIQLASGA